MSLETIVKELIAAEGPLPVARYFDLCLAHPEYGYYLHREPFGLAGDFVTAPEYSQMFGELIGVWCASVYDLMGRPETFRLIELGPGRGSLMADVLRAGKVVDGFRAAANVHFVETSRRLREFQRAAVPDAEASWHDRFAEVPEGPMILVANEFFDAIAFDQYERRGGRWYQRRIGMGPDGLAMGLDPEALPAAGLPLWMKRGEDGDIAELAPIRVEIAREIGARLATAPGAALVIDYGHAASGFADTLQAMRAHEYIDVLDGPGLADLTSHVDFAALAIALLETGAKVNGTITQAEFLQAMGIAERAAILSQTAGEDQRAAIADALDRLTSDEEMGELFKVMAATSPGLANPYPFGPR